MTALIVPALGFTTEQAHASTAKTQVSLESLLASSPVGTCQSRSTSAGSATPPQSSIGEENSRSPILSLAQALEDPSEGVNKSPFIIRNTFIEAPIGRPLSLEGFFTERAIHSCPASRPVSFDEVGAPPGLAGSRPASLDDVVFPPGLDKLGCGNVDKSLRVINPGEQDSFVIRNTFIDTPIQRPLSLEGFLQERGTHSCPTTRPASFDDMDMELPPGLESLLESMDEVCPPTPPAMPSTVVDKQQSAVPDGRMPVSGSYCAGAPTVPPPPMSWGPVFQAPAVAPPPPPAFSPDPCVLRLSHILSEQGGCSESLPSVGSAGHRFGDCKPCAFFHTKGCGNGLKCSFCHLCGPDEKKRRKAEKKECRRALVYSDASYNVYPQAR